VKLAVLGYYGFGNAGDELQLEALLPRLARRGHTPTVLSAAPADTRRRHGIGARSRWNPASLGAALTGCDGLILGGGGLVQDLSGPLTPAYYLGLQAAAQALGKRVWWLAQGFGPVRRAVNQALCRRVLPRAELIVARDRESLEWCRAAGVPAERLRLGADLAWLLPRPARRGCTEWIVCPRADWQPERVPEWLGACARLASARGRRLGFVALGNRGDRAWLQRVRRDARFRDCRFVAAGGENGSALLAEFSGAEWVISQRYHGLVLGALAGAAVSGFGPDPKLRQLLRDLEQPLLDGTDPAASFASHLPAWPQFRDAAERQSEGLRNRAEQGVRDFLLALDARPA